MGYEYGAPAVRVLQDIEFWKGQEQENTALIRQALPGLSEPYAKLLDEWSAVLKATETGASRLLEAARASAQDGNQTAFEVNALSAVAAEQSRELIRQLHSLKAQTAELRSEAAESRLTKAIRDSENFLGLLGGAAGQAPAFRDDSGSAAAAVPAEAEAGESPASRDTSPVPIGGHKLPPLPYPYNALEPYIDEKTMRIHHDKHHQSYVDGLNKAEKKLAEARRSGNFELVKHWERELAFHGAGHYLHTIFWDEMSPQGGGRPTGSLLTAIERSFGSYDAFKKQFSEAADKVEGGGWAILVWSPRSRRLEILTAEKHQNLSQWDVIPLLALDVWEHAYYLKHQNNRAAYIEDWWKVVNWPYVSQRYEAASKLGWKPY